MSYTFTGVYLTSFAVALAMAVLLWAMLLRRKAEAQRRNEILAAMPDGVAILRQADLRVLFANQLFERLAGSGGTERLLQRFAEVAPPRGGCSRPGALGGLLTLVDGERTLELITSELLYGGEPALLAIVRDISRQRALEEELEVKSEALRSSAKMEAIGRLAAGVAHDFNNVLTAVLSNATSVLDGQRLGDPLREDLEEIVRATERGQALTQQLLAVGRRQRVNPEVVDLGDFVHENEDLVRRLLGGTVALEIVLPDEPVRVKIDPVALDRVLLNLVVNARDAMLGGGKLLLRVDRCEAPPRGAVPARPFSSGRLARLAVEDTGAGIPPEVLPHIFEPFYSTRDPQGTGLGLSTVYGAVTQAGGYIHVDSQPGQGARFHLLFEESREPVVARGAQAAVETERAPGPSRHARVLLVDDDDAVRRAVKRLLQLRGHEVVEAASGEEALRIARASDGFELLLTGMLLPGISGIDLAACLLEQRQPPRVLIMSSEDDPRLELAREHGYVVLHKPFGRPRLGAAVQEALAPLLLGSGPAPHVLVVDDDPMLRRELRRILQEADCNVIEACDGAEALHLVESVPLDLVITDIVMPERGGIEVIDAVRKRFPGIKVIAMSGVPGGDTYLDIAEESGALCTLPKPFSRLDVVNAVRNALGS